MTDPILRGLAPIDVTGLTPTSYDESFKRGKLKLRDARDHSQLVEQEILNEIRREELKKARGETIAKEKVDAKIKSVGSLVLEVLAELPEMVAAASEPGKRPEARRLAKEWVDTLRSRLAERLRLG